MRTLVASVLLVVACSPGERGNPASGATATDVSPDAGRVGRRPEAKSDAGADAVAPLPPRGPVPLPPSGLAMGATVIDGGTEFRLWAPHATAASVQGDFSKGVPIPLSSEGSGLFAAKVEGAHAGHHYSFTLTTNGQSFTRTDPRARALESTAGDAVIVDPREYVWKTPPFATPRASEAVIYEMHVPSFNVPAGAANGTFLSAIDKLDHLQALGVTLIELMPSSQFRGTVSWGYNPTSFYAPHTTYGTPSDLRRFVDEAHARGMGVLLDVVYNHTDRQHQGMWCFDGECPSDNGVYFFADPTYASTPWGPRPDYTKKEVADFLIDGLYTWLAEYRMDGFRWDSTNNIRAIDGNGTVPGGRELMTHANDVLHGLFPRALFIAEDYKGYAPITETIAAGGIGFDAQWDGFFGTLNPTVAKPTDDARDVGAVRNVIAYRYNAAGSNRVIYTEDHDIAGNGGTRLPKTIDAADPTSWRARKGSMLGAAVAFTSPGIPMLLQGQEILQAESWTDKLTPAVKWADAVTNAPVLAYYTDLLRLRRNLDGVSKGLLGDNVNVFHVNATAKVLAWQRWGTPGDDAVVIANFSGTAFTSYIVGLPATGAWHVRFNGDNKKYSADFADTASNDVMATPLARDSMPATGAVALAPYTLVVLSR